jgi:drug/metabolite transporter (DMT)-like permease
VKKKTAAMKALGWTTTTCILFSHLLSSSDAFLQISGGVGSLLSKTNPLTVQINGNNIASNSLRISKVGRSQLFAYQNESDDSVGENKPASILSERSLGILVLLTVPLSWGTYTPVVKYLYAIQPPVPGFVFSACYYALAAATTTALALRQTRTKESKSEGTSDSLSSTTASSASSWPVRGGLELGSYLFIANCLQVVGLQTVASDRAGFLVQLTTVMVPFVEALFAGNLMAVPLKTWFACILAFLGLFVMGLDGALMTNPVSTFVTALSSFTQGDLLIVGAAVLYTLHVVRLGRFAKDAAPMKLAATKATSEAIFGVILVGGLAGLASTGMTAAGGLLGFALETGKDILSFFSLFTTGIATGAVPKSALISALGATVWTGLVTCAYTIYAQSFGQSRVR